jgi:alpha-beta hydrolase superfamily lysophospholipase
MRALLLAGLLLTGCSAAPEAQNGAATEQPAAPRALTLTAVDGVKLFARHYPAPDPKALILLFHQAGSSKDEYAVIAPRLVAAGYAALAIDQRSGGDMFGRNETVAAGAGSEFIDAKRDLEAALAWGKAQSVPLIVWGSSYSSAVAFLLAAEHPAEVKALLAFSPGEYLGQPRLVRDAAAQVKAPVFVTSASSSEEVANAKAIFDAVPAGPANVRAVPQQGVHGSSTLIAARNTGAERNWPQVLAFLARVAP